MLPIHLLCHQIIDYSVSYWYNDMCPGVQHSLLRMYVWHIPVRTSIITWKKIGTLSTEIGPAETKIFKFGPKKHISVQVLKMLQMTWAFELKPYTINNEDWWWKMGCLNTKNLWIADMLLFFRCVFCSEVFWYYDTQFFFTNPRYL